MNKLLHERLREIAESVGCKGCEHLTSIVGADCNKFDTCTDCINAVTTAIADEIEKYYIPRPRFEDGEPVQFGDVFRTELGSVECVAIEYNEYNTWVKDGTDNDWNASISADEMAKIHRLPKVIDADGEEIKVGDTVWCVYHTERFVVENIYETSGVMFVHVHGNGDHRTCFKPHELTHRIPDSLEKLRNDMREFVDTEYKIPGGTKTNEWLDRLTAIMERDA